MLYYLLYEVLRKYISPLNVFRYITVRTVYASLTAMFLALVFGPSLIRRLRELQIGQFIREEARRSTRKRRARPRWRRPDCSFHCRADPALGRSHKPLHLISAFCARRFRGHRLYRRLRKSLQTTQPGPHREKENLFPVFVSLWWASRSSS